jgi:hypothetical protein
VTTAATSNERKEKRFMFKFLIGGLKDSGFAKLGVKRSQVQILLIAGMLQ